MTTRSFPRSSAELRETLAELHERLEASPSLEPSLQEDLRRTVTEIEAHLAAEGGEAPAHPLGERLTGLLERFEGSHPLLAEVLGRVIHGLAELGI